MIKFSKVEQGMTLFDIHSERSGNSMLRRLGLWKVVILKVDESGALVSWNGNKPTRWDRRRIEKLYAKPTKKYLAQRAVRP